jgi:hypothetical protein
MVRARMWLESRKWEIAKRFLEGFLNDSMPGD